MKKARIYICILIAFVSFTMFAGKSYAEMSNYGNVSDDIKRIRSGSKIMLKDAGGVIKGNKVDSDYSFALASPGSGMSHEVKKIKSALKLETTSLNRQTVCEEWGRNMFQSFTNTSDDDYESGLKFTVQRGDTVEYCIHKKANGEWVKFHDTTSIAKKGDVKASGTVVLYKNVGKYNGTTIDVKATIKNLAIAVNDDLNGRTPIVHFYPGNIGISVAGVRWVSVTYEFLKHGTNTPITIKGHTSYWDIDGYQGIIVADNTNKGIYVKNDNCKLNYALVQGKKYIYANGLKNSGSERANTAFTEVFEGSKIERIYQFGAPNGRDGFTYWKDARGGVFHSKKGVVPTPDDPPENPHVYACEEVSSEYGKCRIKDTTSGKYVSDRINCNNKSGTGGITSYTKNGVNYSFSACPFKPKYNYDADVVCENCEGTGKNGSYYIQDVADWEAILHSVKRTDIPKLQGYYKKNEVFCRDEFNVVFPNNNTIKTTYIDAGRYLTVNADGGTYANGVYNLKTIKVTRTTQCISSDQGAVIKHNISQKGLGTVNLKYEESIGVRYNGTYSLYAKSPSTDEKVTSIQINSRYPSEVSSGQYYVKTKVTSAYFKLEDDLYRYVKGDGTSQKTKPSQDKLAEYKDLGIANLPVSFKNNKGAAIALSYELPDDTGLAEVIKNGKVHNYESTIDGVYKNTDLIKNSACYKMYARENDKYNSCVKERNGNVDVANNCLKQLKGNPEYKCTIKAKGDPGYPQSGTCKTENNKYYDESDREITEEEFKKQCTCISDKLIGKFKGVNVMPDVLNNYEEYSKQCPCKLNPGNEKECPLNESMGLDDCYRCPETGLCPLPGNICPGPPSDYPGGGIYNVIYRTIDLKKPFPGKSGSTRQTGTNWCKYDTTNKTYICDGTAIDNSSRNQLVYTQIINNRGVTGNSIYNSNVEPLYEVELDSNAIKVIRTDNKKHDYDSWKGITYTVTGSKSEFVNETLRGKGIEIRGKCVGSFVDKRTCMER